MAIPFKVCSCGREHTRPQWLALRFVGVQEDGDGGELELRNCLCGSTVAIARNFGNVE